MLNLPQTLTSHTRHSCLALMGKIESVESTKKQNDSKCQETIASCQCCDGSWFIAWDTFHKWFMSSWMKSYENVFCFNLDLSHTIRSQMCTCHDSLAVMACAKLWSDWPDLIINFHTRKKTIRIRSGFGYHWDCRCPNTIRCQPIFMQQADRKIMHSFVRVPEVNLNNISL